MEYSRSAAVREKTDKDLCALSSASASGARPLLIIEGMKRYATTSRDAALLIAL